MDRPLCHLDEPLQGYAGPETCVPAWPPGEARAEAPWGLRPMERRGEHPRGPGAGAESGQRGLPGPAAPREGHLQPAPPPGPRPPARGARRRTRMRTPAPGCIPPAPLPAAPRAPGASLPRWLARSHGRCSGCSRALSGGGGQRKEQGGGGGRAREDAGGPGTAQQGGRGTGCAFFPPILDDKEAPPAPSPGQGSKELPSTSKGVGGRKGRGGDTGVWGLLPAER